MALQWVFLTYVVAAEAAVALLLTLPYPKMLKRCLVSLFSLVVQPALFIALFSGFHLLDIYWKNEHRLGCTAEICSADDRDRYDKSSVASPFAYASDTSPLQDFCVAIDDPKDAVFVNGKFCKDPKLAKAEYFYYSGLNMLRNTSNPVGLTVTLINVAQIPALNTLGISLFNIGKTNVVALASLSSQNSGVVNPPINADVLVKAFQLDKDLVKNIKSKFWWANK
ncbi:Germin-like protein subfamily 1 member 14 [Hibiscus syriacus]|uniref:Germin-like protein subfamily 1 member 14 n=1 Tax=Hibiscus syriacus TaxID=106335 RepID=A0A6A3A6B8_HIBSY|nr:Germin-like protein subfamily 1 member 14 [Hibiscus syriacus]